jgi:arsenate reductase (glutaredoxin)
MGPLKIYTLRNCSTCRRATAWLRARDVSFQEIPIRETPPSAAELRSALDIYGGNLRRLFNTSGQDYREQKLADRLPEWSADEAIAVLTKNGSLVRRPFAVGKGVALIGFDEARWSEQLKQP